MFKTVPKELKDEMVNKVKAGEDIKQVADMYGVNYKSIYKWLGNTLQPTNVTYREYSRVMKENAELKRILGMIMFDLEKEKKRGSTKK